MLNQFFTNVCELDLLFNFYKVYALVDEMFLAGEIQETSPPKVREGTGGSLAGRRACSVLVMTARVIADGRGSRAAHPPQVLQRLDLITNVD